MEVWKDIEGYEGLYQVSNKGRVKSLGNGKSNNSKERTLKLTKNKDGYLKISLFKNGKIKSYLVHRLVATTFIPNPDNLSEINHIDENKENNCANNLEWCNRIYNINYGTAMERSSRSRTKSVIGVNKVSGLILSFKSAQEAEMQTGVNHCNIYKCCNGKLKSAGNYYWMYAE